MLKRVCAGSAAIVILGALAGCGQPGSSDAREAELERYAAQHGVEVDVTVDDSDEVRSVAVNSPSGGVVGSNLELPPGFPDDVVLHPSESIYGVNEVPGGEGHMIAALSETSIEELTAWHRSEMLGRGWTEQPGSGTGGRLSFLKDGRMSGVNFIPNGDGVSVQVVTMRVPG